MRECRSSLAARMRGAAACAAVLTVAPLAGARPQSCDELPPGSTSYLVRNRATMLCMGGSCPRPALEELGTFDLDGLDHRASMRFTSPVERTVASVWIYATVVKGAPGPLRISLKDDLDGQPVPGLVEESVTVLPTHRGWIEVPFPPGQQKQIAACGVYHVELEPAGAPYDADSYVRLVTVVNRFPLAWQPQVPGQAVSQSFFDLEQAFLFDQGDGEGLVARWDMGNLIYAPVFVVQCTDGSTLGQPYCDHLNAVVLGDAHWGQAFTLDPALPAPVHVNYVATFVRGRGGSQDDKLWGYLYDTVAQAKVPESDVLLVDPPGVLNRSHWFGAVFPGGALELVPGRRYYFMLRSDNQGPTRRGYDFSSERTTLPLPAGVQDPTWGGSSSHVVTSPDGGSTFFASADRADTAFLLGLLPAPVGAVGIYDEGVVLRAADESPAHTAAPGEPLEFRIESRNIGAVAGDIFVDLVDAATGESLLVTVAVENMVGVNKDAGGGTTIPITAPSTPGTWKVDVRVGHFSGSIPVVDDVVRFEVRVE